MVGRAYNYREKPFIHRIGVLDLSPKTGANFNGIGNADATTRRILEKGSFERPIPTALPPSPWNICSSCHAGQR